MKSILSVILICISQVGFTQSKNEYLSQNRFNLYSTDFDFPQKDFKIIGFGAWHGSRKTDAAEITLLKSLIQDGKIKYYLPETDFSIAHFFNEYLNSGETLLLKDLVYHYGYIPSQERSIETYTKWKYLKQINDKLPDPDKIQVLGIDFIASYKYTVKHLLELVDCKHNELKSVVQLRNIIKTDTADYLSYHNSYLKRVLRDFVSEYEQNKTQIDPLINNLFIFKHILNSLKMSFDKNDVSALWNQDRDKIFFDNYINLYDYYEFKSKPQFCRFGFGHLQKDRQNPNYALFFTLLSEQKIYAKNEIISILGFLSKSEVLSDVIFDKNGNYLKYTAVSDSLNWDGGNVYFKGTGDLDRNKLSDLTLFRLNMPDSPYSEDKVDFIQLLSFSKPPEPDDKNFIGKVTTDFVDYALLISNSSANVPLEALK
jgi:hypothetical protein